MPPIPINGDTVSEELLFQKICDSKVTDAMKVYEVMKGKNMGKLKYQKRIISFHMYI